MFLKCGLSPKNYVDRSEKMDFTFGKSCQLGTVRCCNHELVQEKQEIVQESLPIKVSKPITLEVMKLLSTNDSDNSYDSMNDSDDTDI